MLVTYLEVTMSQVVIGLAARAGHGKSTAATWFQEQYGAKIRSFAYPLKEMARRIYGLSWEQLYGTQAQKDAIDPRWGKSGRQLLQFLGTEVCRDVLGADIWVETLFRQLRGKSGVYVIEDVRFPNEAKAIQAHGGRVIKLVCPDAPPPQDPNHASEVGVDVLDADVVVTSTRVQGVEDLRRKIASALWLPQLRVFQPSLHEAARLRALQTASVISEAYCGSCTD
jgi:hypothetical protein